VTLVAGIDSSTQSVKIIVRDLDSGSLVTQWRAQHPDLTEIDPREWIRALDGGREMLTTVAAIAVAAQQHGMVTLDEHMQPIRPAQLWNDTSAAPDAAALIVEGGGPRVWAEAVGSVPLAAFTVAKARWLRRNEPQHAQRVAHLLLPHDYLTWYLRDWIGEPTTDRGDASGTGYWSPAEGKYRTDLLELALGHVPQLPRVAAPHEVVGETSHGAVLAPGTGDNMAAALALDLAPGDVVMSLGTSGTAFALSPKPTADASGLVAGFADATGAFLPLVCTLNAARVLDATARMLDCSLTALGDLAAQASPGSEGLVLIPYLDGERTPNLPDARGALIGMTRRNMTAANLARSAFEGMLCGLADAVDALGEQGITPRRIILIGGAAANPMVAQVARTLVSVPVVVPQPGEYVADGAARQAAWALTGALPPWSARGTAVEFEPALVPVIRENYREATGR
jgi:xylulokinase